DQRLLGGVERIGRVSGHASRQCKQSVVVRMKETIERIPVAGAGALDERVVIRPAARVHGQDAVTETSAIRPWNRGPSSPRFVNQLKTGVPLWPPRSNVVVVPAGMLSLRVTGAPQPLMSLLMPSAT